MSDRGAEILGALEGQPGGPELLRCAGAEHEPALVGGAVRDLLLGRTPRELDVVVARDSAGFAAAIAGELAGRLPQPPGIVEHERFATAVVEWPDGRIDIAQRRAETYPAPGTLPDVRPGSAEEDLQRRDFTVNAIAVPLTGARQGELLHAEHALEDLRERQLRVLHRRSFLDDPTRLLRLARYRARLGFQTEALTAQLAEEAIEAGALGSVSRARVGAEIRLALGERDGLAALSRACELGVFEALDARLRLDEALAGRALSLLPEDGRPRVLLMACLLADHADGGGEESPASVVALLDGLEFTAEDREAILRSALIASGLAAKMSRAKRPSELHALLRSEPSEAIALAAAADGEDAPAVRESAGMWFERLRHVRLQITGQDLLDAGIAAGPELGLRLAAALAARIDGQIAEGPDAETAAALEARV